MRRCDPLGGNAAARPYNGIHAIAGWSAKLKVRAACLALLGATLLATGAVRAETAPALVSGAQVPLSAMPKVSRVVVHKSARRMDLMNGEQVLRSYRVSLGLQPQGRKEREGDFRTPEGRYHLTRRNPRSDFFLSIQVSYPSERDQKHARANGWEPGGAIMIHGLPNRLKQEPDYYRRDWTDGCIAVSNSDMVEIWLFTDHNTPIDILP
jgi:murein L,D-transpeptidase YafK